MTPTKLSDLEPHRVVVATVGKRGHRENQLRSSIGQEMQACNFMNTHTSAWSILDTILGVDPIKLEYIQDKLASIRTTLPTQSARKPKRNILSRIMGIFSSSR